MANPATEHRDHGLYQSESRQNDVDITLAISNEGAGPVSGTEMHRPLRYLNLRGNSGQRTTSLHSLKASILTMSTGQLLNISSYLMASVPGSG